MNVNFTFCAAKLLIIFDICKFVNYILQIFHKKRQIIAGGIFCVTALGHIRLILRECAVIAIENHESTPK